MSWAPALFEEKLNFSKSKIIICNGFDCSKKEKQKLRILCKEIGSPSTVHAPAL